jgi:hypothetical protein
MARPPVEWPIPTHVVELRDRVVVTFTVRPSELARFAPPPLELELVGSSALLSLGFDAGRCLKSVGGPGCLASEFRYAELFTPVRWRPACREPRRGNLLIQLVTASAGLRRLGRCALGLAPAAPDAGAGWPENLVFPRMQECAAWFPESVFPSSEDAEARLLHPGCCYLPDRGGEVVRAAPVHQYARRTTPTVWGAELAATAEQALGLPQGSLRWDHSLHQKRCTHTWSFPPERILVPRPAPAALLTRLDRRRREEIR